MRKRILSIAVIVIILMSSIAVASAGTPINNPVSASDMQTAVTNSTSSVQNNSSTQSVNMLYRWVYFTQNIETSANLQAAENLMANAKKVGYNGFVLANGEMEVLSKSSANYQNNLVALKKYADSIGMQFYPSVLSVGFANAMLSYDPNLVEGLPIKNALYTVHNGQATLSPDPGASLPGGSFESATNNKFAGWDSQDFVGTKTFADTSTKHSGSQSLKVTPGGSVVYISKTVMFPHIVNTTCHII